jgi:bifunctional UDP-N-acetylglucosamine pyrophosphorylase/glucosamine-1-phosphate N-acetyltransferase
MKMVDALVKAIVLAAGEGTRLRPITESRPKSMIPILCRPIIDWHLGNLLKAGVEEVYVVVGHMKEHVVKYIESRGYSGVKIVDQGELRGTGDAIIKASERIGYGEDVLVVYADIFLEEWGIYRRLVEESGYFIVGVEVPKPEDYGVIYVKDQYLYRVVEKPQKPESNLVNAGIYKLNTGDILENRDLPVSPRGEIEATDLVTKIASRRAVRVLAYGKKWVDVGKPWHVIDVNKVALDSISGEVRGEVKDPVYIKNKSRVYIGENSTIYPFTTIEGPVYIGERVEVGPNAYIRPYSVICSGSKIGFSVEVKESVLFENVHAHHLAYIGDSVICENVNLGAGTVLANLRHDNATVKMTIKGVREDTGRLKLGAIIGAGVKTGVNVSIMPGVKIGSNTWILPGVVVYRDVPSNSIYPPREKIVY